MVSCVDLESRLRAVQDPMHYLDTDGTSGPTFMSVIQDPTVPGMFSRPITVDYKAHFGPPSLPYHRPLVRRPSSATEAAILVWLLSVYYGGSHGGIPDRESLRLCPAAQGLYHTAGRADALEKLAKYLASNRRNPVVLDSITAGVLSSVVSKILDDPAGGRVFGKDDSVVAAATEVIDVYPLLDRSVWLPLWGWALGGPAANAAVRTRVFAMKSLQTILRRGGLFPAEVRAADPMAEVLRRLVVQRAPNIAANEREFYLAEAQALVGTIAVANAAAALAETTGAGALPLPPVGPGAVGIGTIPAWVPIGGAVAFVAGLVALVARRRRFA